MDFANTQSIPELDADMAIIGVCEDRRSRKNIGSARTPDEVRKHLYKLYTGGLEPKILDLGNIEAGFEIEDTYCTSDGTIENTKETTENPGVNYNSDLKGNYDVGDGYIYYKQRINTGSKIYRLSIRIL